MLRAGVVAAAGLCFGGTVVATDADALRVQDRSRTGVGAEAIDGSLARAFRELRAAEIAGDRDAVERARGIAVGALVEERVALARAAIEARGEPAARAEDELAETRRALAVRLAAVDADAARELRLECAEDLLLRRLAVDGCDVALAVGMPTAREREVARSVLARVDDALGEVPDERATDGLMTPLFAPDALIATSGVVFRARLLAGMARVVELDVLAAEDAAGEGAASERSRVRARADALLSDAARSELPLPREIGAMLALARVRIGIEDAAMRDRLLAQAQASDDRMRAFVAEVEAWRLVARRTGDGSRTGGRIDERDRDGTPPFPTLGAATPSDGGATGLAILGATAEARARLERGDPLVLVSAPLERALRGCMSGADRAESFRRLRRCAAAFAVRIDGKLRARARAEDAPPLLRALTACSPDEPVFLSDNAAMLVPIAREPIVAPWLAVPLARALSERGKSIEACALLVHLVETAPEVEGANDAMEIALALARSAAARSAQGEVALDRALDVAVRHAWTAAQRDSLVLERVDLAAFPRFTAANAARAAELLQGVSTRAEVRGARDVRALEIEALRAGATPAPAAAGLIADRSKTVIAALADARATPELTARAEVVRAAMLLAGGRPAEAATQALRVLDEPRADERVVLQAASVWMSAATERDDAGAAARELPAAIRTLLQREPEALERALPGIAPAVTRERDRVELALVEGDGARARRDAENRLLVLATALADAAPDDALLADAAIVAELAAGRFDAAITRAERLAERTARLGPGSSPREPDPARRAMWLLAEALRTRSSNDADSDARTRAFALLRELSPIAAAERDAIWWRAQLGQLEILSTEPSRAADIRARLNRLTAIDPSLGGKILTRRFAALRARIGDDAQRQKDGMP